MSKNEFGAPANIAGMLRGSRIPDNCLPLIAAAQKLGPARVQWIGKPPGSYGKSKMVGITPTAWALNGKRATHNEMLAAARLPLEH